MNDINARRRNVKAKEKRLIFFFSTFSCLILAACPSFSQNRDSWQQPEKVMDAVGIKPGMTIGEVGAGHGYFTFKLAQRVGEAGTVYANDIDRNALKSIEDRAQRENITNIVTVLGEVEKPLFPNAAMDLVIMVYVLHDLSKPVELLRNIQPALKPGAPLVILEQDPQKTDDSSGHFYNQERLLEIVAEAGYELERAEIFLSRDNIFVFKKANTSFKPRVRFHEH